MYIGLSTPVTPEIAFAIQRGLFIEDYESPYHKEEYDACDDDEISEVNKNPEWVTRGKTIKELIDEL